VIWLNPYYVSPIIDGDYDIVDHTAATAFGDLAFGRLLAAAHGRGCAF
jgi:glycosidase